VPASQSVWEGVLLYGCGMFIGMTLFEYLALQYGNTPWTEFSSINYEVLLKAIAELIEFLLLI